MKWGRRSSSYGGSAGHYFLASASQSLNWEKSFGASLLSKGEQMAKQPLPAFPSLPSPQFIWYGNSSISIEVSSAEVGGYIATGAASYQVKLVKQL